MHCHWKIENNKLNYFSGRVIWTICEMYSYGDKKNLTYVYFTDVVRNNIKK
jgi:hypothetical protein